MQNTAKATEVVTEFQTIFYVVQFFNNFRVISCNFNTQNALQSIFVYYPNKNILFYFNGWIPQNFQQHSSYRGIR